MAQVYARVLDSRIANRRIHDISRCFFTINKNFMKEEEFKKHYLGEITPEINAKNERAFNALLAYEKNCKQYESQYPEHLQWKVMIPVGERISDFATLYDTTVTEMKQYWQAVEETISNGG